MGRPITVNANQAKSLCKKVGESITGKNLKIDDARLIPTGNNASYSGRHGVMVWWTTGQLDVRCTVVKSTIDYFSVNGENKTGLARREEREE